ncbi:MAG: hypothetical protein ISS74_10285 [Planctomycetes bacterium]|nr:hypothetical protein [Planctomycetota bacterium]
MARHPARNRIAAGAFLLLMLVAAVVVLVLVGGWRFWFEAQRTIRVHFLAAPNIKAGSPVLLAGHPVGRVIDIELVEVPCLPEREHEGLCYVVQVTAQLPKRYVIHQNAVVTIQQALVGQSALINVVDVGYGDAITKPLDGQQTSPFADAARQLGIGDAEKQNLSGILEDIKSITQTVRTDMPTIIDKLKTAGANLAEVSDKIKGTVARVDTVLDENRENLRLTVANARTMTEEAKKKTGEVLDTLNKASTSIKDMLDENREGVKKTVASAQALAAKADAAADDFLPRLKAASESLKTGIDDFQVVAADTKALLATNRGNIAATLQNFRETGDHLRALSKEVRRAPWRLFAKPDKEEVESINLYDAARAFAMAATDLDAVSDTLQVMIEAKDKGVAVDPEILKAMAAHLQETFTKYKEAEDALLKEFERIQK